MKKPGFIIAFLVGLIIILSIAKVVVDNGLSTSGVLISQVDESISSYKTQNSELMEELLSSSSLTDISINAEKLGFVKDDSSLVLGTSKPLAVRQ